MGRFAAPARILAGLALMISACTTGSGGDTTTLPPTGTTAASTTTTSVVVTTSSTSTTTTTTLPPEDAPPIREGDRNETVAAFQYLLNCNGYADLTVDGKYGPATGAAVEAAQSALGRSPDGQPGDEVLAELSRGCSEARQLDAGDGSMTVVGNAAPGDPEELSITMTLDTKLTIVETSGAAVQITVHGTDGVVVEPSNETTWQITTSKDYVIEVSSDLEPATFELEIQVAEGAAEEADWLLTTSGISYRGTKLAIGDPASSTIDKIFEFLGHGVRSGTGEFDTGWDFPGQEGFRGILIEGFRFLFYGPNADNPDRAETLGRIRVVEPTTDADGEPRPPFYVTTPEGIGVGHTLADLLTVYPGVTAGSNADEYWYRLTNSRGELCFYFGANSPDDTDEIVEMSTECRR